MKYRIFALMSLLAMGAGSLALAQDYDDIYYDAKKSSAEAKTKVTTPAKTVAVYGDVPVKYKEAVKSNYSTDRDIDEYNRRGAYDPTNAPSYEVDINGDTIYFNGDSIYDDDLFANTRRIERFYNPDIVILSDDDDLVELYYDESPSVNLIIGTDWGYSSYYPWYSGWYEPWYTGYGWYSPWRWHSPWYYGYHYSYWGYSPWYWYSTWGYSPWSTWGWRHNYWDWNHHYWGWNSWTANPVRHRPSGYVDTSSRPRGQRTGLATNRNTHGRLDARGNNRNSISPRRADGNRSSGVGATTSRNRTGYATSRSGGNMGSRNSSGVTTRSSGSISRSSTGTRSHSSSPSRSYSGGSSSRSSGSYSGGSRSSGSSSHSSGSYSGGGGSHSSGGGGGSHGGSSGGSRRH